jgi:hypothetical protein
MEMRPLTTAGILALAGAAVFIGSTKTSARVFHDDEKPRGYSCTGIVTLIEDPSGHSGTAQFVDGSDEFHLIGKAVNPKTIVGTSTTSTNCGKYNSGTGGTDTWINATTFYGGTVMMLDASGSKHGRIQQDVYFRNTKPANGTKWGSVSGIDGSENGTECWESVGGVTNWFSKACIVDNT